MGMMSGAMFNDIYDNEKLLRNRVSELRAALQDMVDAYVGLDCPDCETMDAETHDIVIQARKALKGL